MRAPASLVASPGSAGQHVVSEPHDRDRDRRRRVARAGDDVLVTLHGVVVRRRPAFERHVRDVVERAALLLGAGEEPHALAALRVHLAGRGVAAAEARPRPAQVQRRRAAQVRSGLLPGAHHRERLLRADPVGRRGPDVRDPGGLVALVGVAVDVDDGLTGRHMAMPAHDLAEHAPGGGVMIARVRPPLGVDDRSVVGEVRPCADRDAPLARDLVHAQDVHVRVDRLVDALRVHGRRSVTGGDVDAVVGKMRLDRAVLRDAEQRRMPPGGRRGSQVRVRAADRLGDPVDEVRVELQVDRLGIHQLGEAQRVGHGLQARCREVVGLVREEPARRGVRVGGLQQHARAIEPQRRHAPGDVLLQPGRDREHLGRHERQLARAALQDERVGIQACALPLRHAVLAREPAEVVARLRRRDVGLPGARAQRRGAGRGSGDEDRDDGCEDTPAHADGG